MTLKDSLIASEGKKIFGKLSKCLFYQDRVHYLDHIISAEGVSMDPEKIKSIVECDRGVNFYGPF